MTNLQRKYRSYARILLATSAVMLAEQFIPLTAMANNNGPSQPEFSTFQQAGSGQTVNPFTGDLTWNTNVITIPGPDGGYPISLSYQSGSGPDDKASWVGYGFSLNPGAINRQKMGIADDVNGANAEYWNKTPLNYTVSVGGGAYAEAFSIGDSDVGLSGNVSLRYNNYKGFGYTAGVGVSADGIVSLGLGVTDGRYSFSGSINPAAAINYVDKESGFGSWLNNAYLGRVLRDGVNKLGLGRFDVIGSNYGLLSYNATGRPLAVTQYSGAAFNLSFDVLGTPGPLPAGGSSSLTGTYSYQRNVGDDGHNSATTHPVYGYMYTENAGGTAIMDYHTEKLTPYNKRDFYLGMPFANYDIFSVSGQELGGGMRLHKKKADQFSPNNVSSNMKIFNIGGELEVGLDVGGGGDLGVGFQSLDVGKWSNSHTNGSTGDEAIFFRFNNDPGGSVEFGTEERQNAAIEGSGNSYTANTSSVTTTMTNSGRSGRSSYIAYHTNSEMLDATNGKYYRAYEKNNHINNKLVKRNGSKVSDGLGELVIFNEDGKRYSYGLPVYSRNEKSFNYGLKGVSASSIQDNFLVYRDIEKSENIETIVGERHDYPYASTFLLTSVVSPDYVDRTQDGITDDDFGGWTKFNYDRLYGSWNKSAEDTTWYRWRVPYNGLYYNRGELSSLKDDMGSFRSGEKEIYYLESTETATHIAYFVTNETDKTVNGFHLKGSGEVRKDGLDAATDISASKSSTAKGSNRLRRLEQIRLFAKDENGDPARLLKTVHFEYDYSLIKGLPDSDTNVGVLVLKKMWTEDEGIVNAKISPYEFDYVYPDTDYPAKYNALEDYGGSKVDTPAYSAFDIDPWGNYQYNGDDRFDSLKTWVNQTPAAQFDPAANQLKVIRRPTGAEVHIQYEQDDYQFVQDKRAHAMVSLTSNSYNIPGINDRYYINTAEIGIPKGADPANNSELIALKKLINDIYIVPDKKIYFKFLYRLMGHYFKPELDECTSEYVSGYVNIRRVNIDSNGLYVILGTNAFNGLPREVCRDYFRANRMGNLKISGDCDPAEDGIQGNDPVDFVMSFAAFLVNVGIPGDADVCMTMNHQMSYLRVPLTKPKKGGGVRVKRLLVYDQGLEAGDAVLYGNEYMYETTDKYGRTISSGVAANEPQSIREENPLVEFDQRMKQSFLNKVIAGEDQKQAEKPWGESILPGPSVGYSKVVVKNIHSGKTTPGFSIHTYLTAKDHPVREEHTSIETENSFRAIPGGYVNYHRNNLWASQGYVFKRPQFNGSPVLQQTYMGDPEDPDTWQLSASRELTYYEPGAKIPVAGASNNMALSYPGMEMTVAMESRKTEDISKDVALEFDVDIGFAGIVAIPYFSFFPSCSFQESKMYTHVTTKVVDYPAIVKSEKVYRDGIYHTTENIAFDGFTGNPIVTRTADGFDGFDLEQSTAHRGTYHSHNFPASHYYRFVGQKSKNERIFLKSSELSSSISKSQDSSGDYYLSIGGDFYYPLSVLMTGDLIRISKGSTDLGLFTVADTSFATQHIQEVYLEPLGAFDVNTQTDTEVNVEILMSGRTNQLSNVAGALTTYGDTLDLKDLLTLYSGDNTIEDFDNKSTPIRDTIHSNKVISASAITLSDVWTYDTLVYGGTDLDTNAWEVAKRGKWRPASQYVYQTSITSATETGERIYKDAGVFSEFRPFDWENISINEDTSWLKVSTATQYSPHGHLLEQKDVLDIYGTTKFGYDQTVPYLQAQNAEYKSVQFESFERVYTGGYVEDGVSVDSTKVTSDYAHAGKQSYQLPNSTFSQILNAYIGGVGMVGMEVTDQLINNGLQVRAWVRDTSADHSISDNLLLQIYNSTEFSYNSETEFDVVSRTGEWTLIEAKFIPDTSYLGDNIGPSIHLTGVGAYCWIDDIRIQPADAQMNCYVYDPVRLRMVASFDDQHFGLYYHYDPQGRLIYKYLETERGKRMVEENRLHVRKVDR